MPDSMIRITREFSLKRHDIVLYGSDLLPAGCLWVRPHETLSPGSGQGRYHLSKN